MAGKINRLLRILYAIQANPGISAADLSFKCDVNIRTIYRDLDELSIIAPIANEGRGTGYRFMGNFALYPLDFTDEEALAFSILPSVIDRGQLPPSFDSAYDKVMSAHRKEQSRRRDMLENIAGIIQMGTPAYRKETPNFLHPIIQAILEERTIMTVYHTQYRNKTTERKIDPYYLIPREQRFYLIGFCHLSGEVRTFRLTRFRAVEITDQRFQKGDFNLQKHLRHTWSIEQGTQLITFKVKFYSDVARYVKEEELFVRPRMKDQKDGSMIFEVTVNNENEFLRWLLQYGPSAEILEPAHARERQREQLQKWLELYS